MDSLLQHRRTRHRLPYQAIPLVVIFLILLSCVQANGSDPVVSQSVLPEGLVAPMTASDGDSIYLFGGRTAENGVSRDILRIDPASLETVKVGELPAARYAGSATYLAGKIYIFGGANWVSGAPMASDQIVEFDPSTGEAKNLVSSLPEGLFNTAAASDGDKAYIFGGYRLEPTPERRDRIIQFDPDKMVNAATTLQQRLPNAIHSASAAFDDEAIVVVGGSGNGLQKEIIFFDPSTKTLEVADFEIPYGIRNAGITGGDNAIHVLGGSTTNSLEAGTSSILKITADQIIQFNTTLNEGTWSAGSALVGAKAYLTAGQTDSNGHSSNVTWVDLKKLEEAVVVEPPEEDSENGEPEDNETDSDSEDEAVDQNTTGEDDGAEDDSLEPEQTDPEDAAEDSHENGTTEREPLPAPAALPLFLLLLGIAGVHRGLFGRRD